MAFEIRSEILGQISKTQDENLRVVLLLLLGVLEANAEAIGQVSRKIDVLLDDEEKLRKTVLNGLAPTHHDDHEWLRHHREFSEANQELIDEAKPMMRWIQEKMEAEKEQATTQKGRVEKAVEVLIDKGITVALGAAAALAGVKWL